MLFIDPQLAVVTRHPVRECGLERQAFLVEGSGHQYLEGHGGLQCPQQHHVRILESGSLQT